MRWVLAQPAPPPPFRQLGAPVSLGLRYFSYENPQTLADEHRHQQDRQEDERKNDPPNAPLGPILHRLNVHSRALKGALPQTGLQPRDIGSPGKAQDAHQAIRRGNDTEDRSRLSWGFPGPLSDFRPVDYMLRLKPPRPCTAFLGAPAAISMDRQRRRSFVSESAAPADWV